MIHFPQDETGKQHKLSRPWHGPYHVISRDDPDITAVKYFFPMSHQSKFIGPWSTNAHHPYLMTFIGRSGKLEQRDDVEKLVRIKQALDV